MGWVQFRCTRTGNNCGVGQAMHGMKQRQMRKENQTHILWSRTAFAHSALLEAMPLFVAAEHRGDHVLMRYPSKDLVSSQPHLAVLLFWVWQNFHQT